MTCPAAAARPARYFATVGGHVHAEGCGHAHQRRIGGNTRKAQQLVTLDGMTHAQVIEAVGSHACAHCIDGAKRARRKVSSSLMDELTGATARREAAAAERARRAELLSDALLVALEAAFAAAESIEDYATAGVLYGQINKRRETLGIDR